MVSTGLRGELVLFLRLTGHDAVLSCLGFQPERPQVTGYLQATKASITFHNIHVYLLKNTYLRRKHFFPFKVHDYGTVA
jgi:hypothetical protein